VGLDDDIHVYANPFLNPPTWASVARLWQEAYEGLYIPLAYTILAAVALCARVPAHAVSSIGHTVSVDPLPFHVASIGLHVANAWLCYLLARRLTRNRAAALLGSLVFAAHPLQVESVAWISELRGLTSSCFALIALNLLVSSRRARDRAPAKSHKLLLASALLVVCAMLCKPGIAALPLVALAIDRIALETSWRRSITAASIWAGCVLPIALVTRFVQFVPPASQPLWWQRPFVAGDALAFYVLKSVIPVDLCVQYGRTPRVAMSHGWGYLDWLVPVGLLVLCYLIRARRPITWLGALLFGAFLLPTLGLVPFSYQIYSTVADRYAYLSMIGVGLVVADTVAHARRPKVATGIVSATLLVLAVLAFNQSGYWGDNTAFLHHTIDVNPDAAFAYNNLGDRDLANGDYGAALADYQACVQHDPDHVIAYINLAEVYTALNRPAEAEDAINRAVSGPGMTADDYSNLGLVLMKMNQRDRAIRAFSTAVGMNPTSPKYLFNEANALSADGQFDRAEAAYRRCISLAPTLAGAHTGLGIVLAETNRLADALAEFRTAVRLQPNDRAALDDLEKAEHLMASQAR
jgi:tetratricopeptide (TPR) repeat protein